MDERGRCGLDSLPCRELEHGPLGAESKWRKLCCTGRFIELFSNYLMPMLNIGNINCKILFNFSCFHVYSMLSSSFKRFHLHLLKFACTSAVFVCICFLLLPLLLFLLMQQDWCTKFYASITDKVDIYAVPDDKYGGKEVTVLGMG